MKKVFFLLIFLCAATSLLATVKDSCAEYKRLIHEGDAFWNAKMYIDAFNKYNSAHTYAQRFCVEFQDAAQQRINRLFLDIDSLRFTADSNAHAVDSLAQEAGTANARAKRLAEAIYFYDGLYGLVQDKGRGKVECKFFNQEGYEVKSLGIWWNAGPFINGYARVQAPSPKKDNTLTDSLLDVNGKRYEVAYDVKSLTSSTRALDLYRRFLPTIPDEVYKRTQLQILILNTNFSIQLSKKIAKLQNLIHLDLSGCKLKELEPAVFQLTNLETLFLSDNDGLTNLSASIKDLKKLRSLHLDFCTRLKKLPDSIATLKNLEVLDLYKTNIENLPDMRSLKKLRHFAFRRGKIPIAELQAKLPPFARIVYKKADDEKSGENLGMVVFHNNSVETEEN